MENKNQQAYDFSKIVDLLIRLGVLYLLVSWCFDIMRPFLSVLLWGSLLAVAIFPIYKLLLKITKERKIISAAVIVVLLLSVLALPTWLISKSFSTGYDYIAEQVSQGKSIIPPPIESTKEWPAVAKPIISLWELASTDITEVSLQHKEKLQAIGTFIIESLRDLTLGIVQFIVSILLAGAFLIYSDTLTSTSIKIFKKVVGENGESFLNITVVTIRNVFKGVLGVAAIQAALAGIGFFAAGVPYAGLWTVICLFLAVIQVGVGPVAIPIAIYMFSATDTLTAVLLAVWMIPVTISDNILRPILMGIGSPVPMLVIFIGSIGGFILNGFIGLFLGAIFFALGYKLFMAWIEPESIESEVLEAKAHEA